MTFGDGSAQTAAEPWASPLSVPHLRKKGSVPVPLSNVSLPTNIYFLHFWVFIWHQHLVSGNVRALLPPVNSGSHQQWVCSRQTLCYQGKTTSHEPTPGFTTQLKKSSLSPTQLHLEGSKRERADEQDAFLQSLSSVN